MVTIMGITTLFTIMVWKLMDDKTPHQLIVENIEYIRKIIRKISIRKNLQLDNDEIDDIFQNVCIKLLDKGIAQFKGECKFQTYVFKIVVNDINEYVKLQSKTLAVSRMDYGNDDNEDENQKTYHTFFERIGSVNIDYADIVVYNDVSAIIDDVIKTFNDIDKLIFEWYFLDTLNQVDIARMVKLSQPSVSERIEKIKRILKEAIKKKYPEIDKELRR